VQYDDQYTQALQDRAVLALRPDRFAEQETMRWLGDSHLTLQRPRRRHNAHNYPSSLQRYGDAHPPEADA